MIDYCNKDHLNSWRTLIDDCCSNGQIVGKTLLSSFTFPRLTISLFPRRENVQIQGLKYYLEQQQAAVVQQ